MTISEAVHRMRVAESEIERLRKLCGACHDEIVCSDVETAEGIETLENVSRKLRDAAGRGEG